MTDAENKKPHIYEESTQYRHWRFSPEQLWETRNSNTTNAINRLQKYNQEHEEAPNADNPETGNTKEYLTAKEELQLCRFYEKQLQIMSKHCKFNDMVMATAVIYMKRFYLHNSTMDYHPKDIFLTCLFLATKSESERISIEDFGKKLRLPSTKDVLGLEFTVSQGLKFQYYVYHPYRPAYGFFLDMQTGPIDTKLLKETYKKVERTIAEILLTDLPLIYQPAQLALAAFMQAGKENEFDKQIERYITDRFRDDATNLLSIIERILALFKTSTPVSQEEAKKIDYKLKLCTANNPESAMLKRKLAEQEEERKSKKAKTTGNSPSFNSTSSDSSESSA